MVQSGLVDDPRVSQLRLTAHLGLAFLIFAAMFWLALSLLAPARAQTRTPRRRCSRMAFALTALVFVMALAGGLVAGIRAGFAYNTFPLMNGSIVPPEMFTLEPWYRNFFDNMATVQFDHRVIAWLLALLIPLFWWRVHRLAGRARRAPSWRRGSVAGARGRADRARHRDAAVRRAARRSPPRIRRAPCCCSRRRSMSRTRCAGP